jgi:hypothetical protein
MTTCPKCSNDFKYPSILKRHMARKTPCTAIIETADSDTLDTTKEHKCRFCSRTFSTATSMHRHIRVSCKVAKASPDSEQSTENVLQKQLADQQKVTENLQAQVAAQSAAVAELTSLLKNQLTDGSGTNSASLQPVITNITVNNNTVNNITQINIRSFDGEERIVIPAALVKAAFTENPKLIEYCSMTDEERTHSDVAAPFVLEALLDLVRRAHRDPSSRNVYLSPNRADQAMVWVPPRDATTASTSAMAAPAAAGAQHWEVRALLDVVRQLFDSVAGDLQKLRADEAGRKQLPFNVQCAASWVPTLYEEQPERFVADGKATLVAHLTNNRPRDQK